MFDASKLIGELLGAAGGGATGQAGQSGQRSGAGDLLKQGQDYLSNNAGGIAGGTLAGGLAGMMMGSKKGRKMAKKAATYGGLALVAGLAYKAYNDYQSGKSAQPQGGSGTAQPVDITPASAPPATQTEPARLSHIPAIPAQSGFAIEDESDDKEGFGAVLVSAMIAAAKADGQIDGAEHQAIFGKIEELELSADEKAFLFDQLNSPLDIDSLVGAASSQEQAVEIYIASVMAIEVDTPSEQAYLNMLAARLGLEPALTSQIHQTLAAAGD